jgi:hypothetical protein
VFHQERLRIRAMQGGRPANGTEANGESGEAADRDFVGLAISGGGIRSAAFATGVLQGLVAGGLLEKVDYLSTVSGGGYIGSSLTWYLTRGIPDPHGAGTIPAGTTAANFPYGSGDIGGRTGARQPALDYIRDHGTYLTPDTGLNLTSAISVVARSMFTSLLAYLLLVWLVMVPLRWGLLFQDFSLSQLPNIGAKFAWLAWSMNPLWWGASALLIAMGVLAVSLSMRTAAPAWYPQVQYAGLNRAQRIGGILITLTFVLLVIGSLPYFLGFIASLWGKVTAAGLSTILGTLLSAYELSKKRASGRFGALRIVLGATLLFYGLLQAGYLLSASVDDWKQLLLLAYATLNIGGLVNINHVGIHPMYRDRLMEVFMPDTDSLRAGTWALATAADNALLESFCGETVARPYHLINANIVLVDSLRPKYRGRAGDSFLLSPLYCGSGATGWRRTDLYMKGGWSLLGTRGMTLATAMAISGAAANPHTGVAGRGITRNPLVSALMTLLNLRLGYWAPHPERESAGPFPPNFLLPGLRSGLFGRGLREDARNVELTDGGHFENLGIYELLRRRLRLIIVSDASADPAYEFGELANALERARVDFGVEITFRTTCPLAEIVPDSHTAAGARRRVPRAVRPFAVGDIFYNNGPGNPPDQGLLIYLKSTLTDGLSEDIYGYYVANPEFPNQPTSDQFFDEGQFEAYRELGYQLCLQMVKVIQAEQWV